MDKLGDRAFSSYKYIESIENKLKQERSLSNHEYTALYSNLAAAQYELGLYRKCIRSCQSSLELTPHHARSCILIGKALSASGKISEAMDIWTQFLHGDTMFCDVLLVQELRDLVNAGSNAVKAPERTELSGGGGFGNASASRAPTVSAGAAEKTPVSTPTKSVQSPQLVSPASAASDSATKTPVRINAPSSAAEITAALQKTALGNSNSPNSSGKSSPVSPVPSPISTAAVAAAAARRTSTRDKATTRKALVEFHKKEIGNAPDSQIKPLLLRAMKTNLPHLSGEDLVDDLVGLGYINVNAGKHALALTIFKLLLDYRPDLPSALIGMGSIHAMQRQLDLADVELTEAINIDPTIADAWKRRGQTRAAKNDVKRAIKDLTKAISLNGDADIYNQRGLVYNQAKNHLKALSDFRAAQAKGLSTAPLMNYIGMCEGQLGNVVASIEAHKAAVVLDPKLREAYLNMALMHKEAGDWQDASRLFAAAISADSARYFAQAHNYRAVMWYQLGCVALSLKETTAALAVMQHNIASGAEQHVGQGEDMLQALVRSAVCCQALGQYKKSIELYDKALLIDTSNNCWFQREIALFFWNNLDADLSTFSSDDRVDSRLKDGWCKHVPFRDYMARAQSQQFQGVGLTAPYVPLKLATKVPSLRIKVDDDGPGVTVTPHTNDTVVLMSNYDRKVRLVEITRPLSKWVQLQTPGFLPNKRQHRMFGLAVLQMARSLRRHIMLIQMEGVGLEITDASSSKIVSPPEASASVCGTAPGKASSSSGTAKGGMKSKASHSVPHQPSSGKRGACESKHPLAWRDLYDIAVRWRQFSEPNDPVWWIDRFPQKAFADGFGLQTPIVNGQMKTVRYYPYFPMAFAVLKSLMREGYYNASDKFEHLGADKMAKFEAAGTLAEMYTLVGKDFYVVVPCPSLKSPGLVLEGTRLTLVARDPDGFEFTIRTPGRPYRWSQYEAELDRSFHRLEDAFLSYNGGPGRLMSPQAVSRKSSLSAAEPSSCGDDSDPSPAVSEPPRAPETTDTNPPLTASTSESTKRVEQDQLILKQALELFYLWVTFAPLSRGTAACGYAAFMAVLLAHGKTLARPMPQGKQLDWEAIFAKDCGEFVDKVLAWFPLVESTLTSEQLAESDEGFRCLGTLRDMLEILALPYAED